MERCGMISSCELNTSLPWCLHPGPIKPVVYRALVPEQAVASLVGKWQTLFRKGFGLRCFQPLSLTA